MAAPTSRENRDRTGLVLRLMQRLGKPFFQFIRGSCLRRRRTFSSQSPTTRFRFITFPISTAAAREVLNSRRRNPRTCTPWSEPPKAGQRIVQDYGYNIRSRGSRNTLLLMVTEGTLAIARETRSVFREDKCCSNKSTYHFGCFARGIASQLFLRSIFRLITISLRLSKEDTLRAGDFAPSNSA